MTLPLYRKRTPRRRPEAQLQKAVVQHLKLSAMPKVLWHSIPNESNRGARATHELKLMGLLPGAADLCIVIDGHVLYLELKAKGGKQSPEQVAFEAAAKAAGADYELADSIDVALTTLRYHGAIKPTASRRAAA